MSCASSEGTLRFRERHERKHSMALGHIREFMGLHLTSIGIGTYLGEPDSITDELVTQAAMQSIRSGAVNVIDTAINYRHQKAERSVGRALKGLMSEGEMKRNEVFLSTKNGYLAPDADSGLDPRTYLVETLIKPGILSPDDIVAGSHCMSTDFLRDQMARSLKNLGLGKIDLMYLHNPAESQLTEIGRGEFFARLSSAFAFYEEERELSRIGYYGMATWSCFRVTSDRLDYLNLEDVVRVAEKVGGKEHGFRFVQLPYNLAMPEASILRNQYVNGETLTLLQAAKKLDIGIFTSAPFLQGKLLARPDISSLGFESPSLACLQFARSTSGVTATLVGQKSPEHVKENLLIAKVPPLTPEEFKRAFQGKGI